jgi:uncharacterized protein (DUF885 family)
VEERPEVPDPRVADLAEEVLQRACAADPTLATRLGDHRFDGELPDPSAAARDRRIAELENQWQRALALTENVGGPRDLVDLEVLAGALSEELVLLRDVREPDWNPMEHNPGSTLELLLTREFAPLPERLESAAQRLTGLGDYFIAARDRLSSMPSVFVETARLQLRGLRTMCTKRIPEAADGTAVADAVLRACAAAVPAVDRQVNWLASAATDSLRERRLGVELFASKLRWTLGTELAPDELLAHALAELDRATEAITEAAARWEATPASRSSVRDVLDTLAREVVDDQTILGYCRGALVEATAFIADQDLVTLPDEPIGVIELPEVDRGVAVAYCRAPGPLEAAGLRTEFAVSPTPEDWSAERVSSFYREYNVHMLHNLTVHEAMPGHAVQVIAANHGGSPVTRTWRNGAFVEGWAVYAEELMASRGYRSGASARDGLGLLMQQLKMQLRTIINTVLDIRYHCDGLTETEAMRLMTERGFQEEGEASGKWRRVQLSSTQLCEYFTGYLEVRALAADLRAARPGAADRSVHDEMLAHGAPPVPQLRRLVGLAPRG